MWWAAEPLARRALGGSPPTPSSHARLLNLVDGLCATIGTSHPEVRVRDEAWPQRRRVRARRRPATLVVTQGLLDQLNRVELEGVVAQQLTRIRCHDMLPATVTVATLGIGATILVASRAGHGHGPGRGQLHPLPARAYRALEKMEAKGTEVRGASRATAQLWFADPGRDRRP